MGRKGEERKATSWEFAVELLSSTEEMRDLLVEFLCEGAFADGGPLAEVVDGELARQRACRGNDEVFEYATRHCCELLVKEKMTLVGEERKRKDIRGRWLRLQSIERIEF